MMKLDLILQIMNKIDHCLKKKIKSNWINELDGKIMIEFVG